MNQKPTTIKAIVGLGNPGTRFKETRHNIGFAILDAVVDSFDTTFQKYKNMERAEVNYKGKKILLIKPQTFMNNSGEVIPYLQKQGIKPEEILVIHDELELPFGSIKFKFGGSHKGHNGLKSIINYIGKDFWRLRFGISRPEDRDDVSEYVLSPFSKTEQQKLASTVEHASNLIVDFVKDEQKT